jgi:radical SAM superfamily enzyme YgiQ (UPF0313 family)
MKNDVIILTGVSGNEFQRAIGAYRIASHLREHGYSVQVIDFIDEFEVEELLDILDSFTGTNTVTLCVSTTFLKSRSEDLVSSTYKKLRTLSDKIRTVIKKYKNKYNKIKILGGGANISWYKEDDIFDVLVTGYGELAVLEYVESLTKKNKRIYPRLHNKELINGDMQLIDVSTMRHIWQENDLILPGETLPIEISRGCIFNCKFCSYPLNGKKKFDYLRDPHLIQQEMIRNYEKYGVTNYMFSDDTFNDSTYKLQKLHEVFTKLPFKLQFVAYLRLDLLYAHPEQVMLLKEMGLKSAAFGIESMHPRTAKFIGKGLAKDKVKDFLPKLYYDLWKEEISVICSLIVGLPYETLEQVEESFNWFKNSGINSIWMPLAITPSNFYLSDIDKNYNKYGYELGEEIGYWKSPLMDRKLAEETAHKFTTESLKTGTVNSWALFLMLSYKLQDADSLQKLKWSEVNWAAYSTRKQQMIQEYKTMLLECAKLS